jgi:hypothetical protein
MSCTGSTEHECDSQRGKKDRLSAEPETLKLGGPTKTLDCEMNHDHIENLAETITITFICLCEEPLLIRASYAKSRACPARARWGQNDGSVAHAQHGSTLRRV